MTTPDRQRHPRGRSRGTDITVGARPHDRVRLESAIADILETSSLSPELLDPVLLATWEAVTNAIVHGGTARPLVTLRFDAADGHLVVTVADTGPGFDAAARTEALRSRHPLEIGGKGLLIMRRSMDDVGYDFPPAGGTVVTLFKRVGQAPGRDFRSC